MLEIQKNYLPKIALSISLYLLLLLPVFSSAQANLPQETGEVVSECEDAPFSSESERKRVKAEDPDCYEFRENYKTGLMADAVPLQDTSLLTRHQLLQIDIIAKLEQLIAILSALLEARR